MRPPRTATPEPLDPESVSPSGPRRAAKQAGLLALCAIWVLLGLVGHDPWKTEDAITFGVAWEMARGGQVVMPMLAGEFAASRPPLVPALAAAAIHAFSPPLEPHNAARLAAGLLLAVTLAAAALASRELNGRAFRWLPVLILVGSIGFWERAHALSSELGLTAGIAVALYGFALALRRPIAGGACVGIGTAVAFLAFGFVGPLWVALTAAIVPAASPLWRTRAHLVTVGVALAVALPLSSAWPLALHARDPAAFAAWLAAADLRTQIAPIGARGFDPLYTLRNLPWFAWPAAPLVLWTLWIRGRGFNGGLVDAGIVLPGTLALVILAGLSLQNEPRIIHALPVLVPLALVASLEVDSLKRGFSGALDWFGILTFGLLALVVWALWIEAATSGMSLATARMLGDSEIGWEAEVRFWALAAAILLTLLWIALVRPARRSNRRAVLNWAVGVALLWGLMSTIWLPYIDQRRTYRVVAGALATQIPAGTCVSSRNLGEAQRALLHYYAGLATERVESERDATCPLLLVQQGRTEYDAPVPEGFEPVWQGSRRGDTAERFVLFRRTG